MIAGKLFLNFLQRIRASHEATRANDRMTKAARLLWEESRRQVVRQEADLDELRTRTLAMLSVIAVIAAIFGSRLAPHLHGIRLIALIGAGTLFVATVICALLILRSEKGVWSFAHNLDTWLQGVRIGTYDELDVSLNLAEHFEDYRRNNQPHLDKRHKIFIVICVLVGIQLFCWGIAAL